MTAGLAGSVGFGQQQSTSATAPGSAADAAKLLRAASPGELKGEMLYRKLGQTGEIVSAIGLGGSHIAKATMPESETIRLYSCGYRSRHMDNSWDYNEGRSEIHMGNALSGNGYRLKHRASLILSLAVGAPR